MPSSQGHRRFPIQTGAAAHVSTLRRYVYANCRSALGEGFLLALGLLSLLVSGCDGVLGKPAVQDGSPVVPTVEANPTEPDASQNASVFDRPLERLVIEINVHRFAAPRGAFTTRQDLWNMATGPLTDAAVSLRLNDNGFRAAVGRESDRKPLRDYLDGLHDVRSAMDTAAPDASRQIDLEIGPCPPLLSVFYYDAVGKLRGLNFSEAKARLKVGLELRSPNLRDVFVQIMPEFEEPPGPQQWLVTPQGARQVADERRHPLKDLTFSAIIPAGGFLLLGPTPAVYDRPLVARPFFVGQGSAFDDPLEGAWESIYIISPMARSYTQTGS